jgi:hypothetical protein
MTTGKSKLIWKPKDTWSEQCADPKFINYLKIKLPTFGEFQQGKHAQNNQMKEQIQDTL